MSADDYLASLRANPRNAHIFDCQPPAKVRISVASLEAVVRHAFNSGHVAGVEKANSGKSIFDQIFGTPRREPERTKP